MKVVDLAARVRRLDALARGLAKELAAVSADTLTVLLYRERRGYLEELGQAPAGVEGARVTLARAVLILVVPPGPRASAARYRASRRSKPGTMKGTDGRGFPAGRPEPEQEGSVTEHQPKQEGGVTEHQPADRLPEDRRKEVFRSLVEAQDQEMTVPQSRQLVAQRFGLSEEEVRSIEREGLDGLWPPL
jgi:hypothetical protein